MANNKAIISLLKEIVDCLSRAEERIVELEKRVKELEAAPKTEVHNHYHSATPVPMPSPPNPYTPVPMPTFPWQGPISMGAGSVTSDPNYTYTINNSFPKPDDDGREGIAVH